MDAVSFKVTEAPGGYLAEAEGGSIVTVADDFESLKAMMRDAVACHYDEADRPAKISVQLEFERVAVS